MTRISETTKESAQKSRTATQSVGQLSGLANQLRESVAQFKVGDEDQPEAAVLSEINAMVDSTESASSATATESPSEAVN